MADKEYFALGKWIELADDVYAESKELMYKKVSSNKRLAIPAFLLHWSIELYLKAFLMQHNKFQKGHDLNQLFGACIETDPKINTLCLQTEEVRHDQKYWINLINPYGDKEGGMRYLNSKRKSWSFTVIIYDFLDDMVRYIKESIDPKKDITHYI